MTPVSFALLALGLAGPAPALLARARWTFRVPRAALVLWQSLAAAAVLAALSAGLSASVAVVAGAGSGDWRVGAHVLGFVVTAVVGARLAWATTRVAVTTRRRRRRHRALVDLVGVADDRIPGLRILAGAQPVAYCLPGTRSGRVVVSDATLEALHPAELESVLAHERAHLRARHDLLLEAFTALHAAFPKLVSSTFALQSVRALIEMLADDAAARRTGGLPLARALVTLVGAPVPAAALAVGAGAEATLERLQRLAAARTGGPVLSTATYAIAAAIFVLPTVTIALPWLETLWAWAR